MPTETTPGVYVEEIRRGPQAISERDSAVPAFVGFTEWAVSDAGETIGSVPVRIASMLEFERHFGGPEVPMLEVQIVTDAAGSESCTFAPPPLRHLLHLSLRLYFDNGGGPCWVASAGSFETEASHVSAARLLAGLEAIRALDDATLLVVPDAVRCDAVGFATVVRAMLVQCATRRDRFAILDVQRGDAPLTDPGFELAAERAKFGTENLEYGAAYLPFLRTLYPYALARDADGRKGANVVVRGPAPGLSRTLADLVAAADAVRATAVHAELARHAIVLPPSGAMAGVYGRTDRERGIWKAPANERLHAIAGPVVPITDAQQEALNVDSQTGRSLNAIRAFPGRGTLVWGARTLAGNDHDWRYVPVRRLCMQLEQSIAAGTRWVVFEPNDATAWAKVRGAVENFLTTSWRDGALQGTKPEHAFYVRCGLGQTMTAQDVVDGRLVIEVGLAVVRPAEFLVLRIEQRTAS